MRARLWLAALLLAAGAASPARAQSTTPWGTPSGPLQYNIVGANTSATTPTMTVPNKFALNSFFHTPTQISNQRVLTHSVYPTPDKMPDKNYLKFFGFRVPKP
jgi:hypothetical protein